MRICFVQPDTDYQIEKNRHALALTFPQLISDLEIKESNYCLFVAGKSKLPFEEFILKNKISHVFITSITSTFPYAVEFAKTAKSLNCVTVLGGLFASINYKSIVNHFSCFDYVISGKPDASVLSKLQKRPLKSTYISVDTYSNYSKPLGEIIIDKRFREIYSEQDTVCYELANGCTYNCSFCTMRKAFPSHKIQKRELSIIQTDLSKLSQYWKKIKLIDDDISLSLECLQYLNFKNFSEVIAETRIDHITEKSMSIFNNAGITHLIVGFESLDPSFLKLSKKTSIPNLWPQKTKEAIELCKKYNIILRPVLMILNPMTTMDGVIHYKEILHEWIPENNIELLFSFYTPHPGVGTRTEYQRLLTNNLRYFVHLHCVWLPPLINKSEIYEISDIYNELVTITKSLDYNPPINLSFNNGDEYSCFFR